MSCKNSPIHMSIGSPPFPVELEGKERPRVRIKINKYGEGITAYRIKGSATMIIAQQITIINIKYKKIHIQKGIDNHGGAAL
jgi:hypothetical protein